MKFWICTVFIWVIDITGWLRSLQFLSVTLPVMEIKSRLFYRVVKKYRTTLALIYQKRFVLGFCPSSNAHVLGINDIRCGVNHSAVLHCQYRVGILTVMRRPNSNSVGLLYLTDKLRFRTEGFPRETFNSCSTRILCFICCFRTYADHIILQTKKLGTTWQSTSRLRNINFLYNWFALMCFC